MIWIQQAINELFFGAQNSDEVWLTRKQLNRFFRNLNLGHTNSFNEFFDDIQDTEKPIGELHHYEAFTTYGLKTSKPIVYGSELEQDEKGANELWNLFGETPRQHKSHPAQTQKSGESKFLWGPFSVGGRVETEDRPEGEARVLWGLFGGGGGFVKNAYEKPAPLLHQGRQIPQIQLEVMEKNRLEIMKIFEWPVYLISRSSLERFLEEGVL